MAKPSVDNASAVQSLLIVLSVTAGCTDVIGFLGLSGLFTAHITGNLVLLAAHVAAGTRAQAAEMLSVPVFIVVASLATLLADALEAAGHASLRLLLVLHFLLLVGFLAGSVATAPPPDTNAMSMVIAGMLGVSAMAVQNALVQIALNGAPATAVMTSNVTRFAIDVGRLLHGGDPANLAMARRRAMHTLPVIVGFAAGCGLGAACEVSFGLWSLALPAGLALLALAIGFAAEPGAGQPA